MYPGRQCTLMKPARERLMDREIRYDGREYHLVLDREDLGALYPGMARFELSVAEAGRLRAVFRTNTYEYPPGDPRTAEDAARERAAEWERDLSSDPGEVFRRFPPEPVPAKGPGPDMVVIQGSPRPDGNCAVLAGWAVAAAAGAGRTARVIYPHDLDIHPCIGCYQCYNTGTCVFPDDMREIIGAVRSARLLVVCSPVYTNTVPAGLKLVIDRMQAYHAELTFTGGGSGQEGLLLAVAGRSGSGNFTCVSRVVHAFFRNLGMEPAGDVLTDGMDRLRDIRAVPGRKDEVTRLVAGCLAKQT